MGYTKRQFITKALSKIGLANYAFDMQPEQLQGALDDLDAMMAEWNARGIRLGYPMPGSPEDSSLDDETAVPDRAWQAVIYNLAVRIADDFGKQVSRTTLTTAKFSLNALLNASAVPMERQFPSTLPAGAGNKPWRYDEPFMTPPTDPVEAGPDGPLEFT